MEDVLCWESGVVHASYVRLYECVAHYTDDDDGDGEDDDDVLYAPMSAVFYAGLPFSPIFYAHFFQVSERLGSSVVYGEDDWRVDADCGWQCACAHPRSTQWNAGSRSAVRICEASLICTEVPVACQRLISSEYCA